MGAEFLVGEPPSVRRSLGFDDGGRLEWASFGETMEFMDQVDKPQRLRLHILLQHHRAMPVDASACPVERSLVAQWQHLDAEFLCAVNRCGQIRMAILEQ